MTHSRGDLAPAPWASRGRLKEDVVDGLENAPAAFIGLLAGRNSGKLVVRLAQSGG